jgi:hypothetical protein
MPSPAFALEGKRADPGVTNVRNTGSPHWRRWLGPEPRCLVPLSAFSEFNKEAGGDIWFALGEERPLARFAGIRAEGWTSVRTFKDGETTDDLYAFLTCPPNAEVGAPIVLLSMLTATLHVCAPGLIAGEVPRRQRIVFGVWGGLAVLLVGAVLATRPDVGPIIKRAWPWIGDFWRSGAMPGAVPAGPPPA